MAHEPVALTTSIESAPPSGADYDAICAAVMETVRGRWFLQEYARRNRNADTSTVLNAIERLEAAIQGERTGQVVERFRFDLNEMAEAVALAKAEIAAIKPDDAVAGNARPASAAQVHDRATSDLLATAEQIQDLSWRLREQGIDAHMCDGLDSRAREIVAACSQPDLTGQRTHAAIEMLRSLEGRLNDLMSFSNQKPTSTTHAFPLSAPGNGAHPEKTELILEPLIPATAVVVHRTEHDPARDAAVIIDHEPLVPARPSLHVEVIPERPQAVSEPPVERERVPTVSTLLATPVPVSARHAAEDERVPTVALLESKMADLLASMSAPSSRPVIALDLAQRLAEASPLVMLRELEIARTTVVVTREPPPPQPEAKPAPAATDQEDPAAFLFEPLPLPTTRSPAAPAALQLDPEPLPVAEVAPRPSEPEPEPVVVLEPVPFKETIAAAEPAEDVKPAALMLEPVAQAEATRSISPTQPEPPPSDVVVSVATPEPEPLVLASEPDKAVVEVEVTHTVTTSAVVGLPPDVTATDVLAPVPTRSLAEPLVEAPVVAQVEQLPEPRSALVIVAEAPEPTIEAAAPATLQQFEGQFAEIFQAAPARPLVEHTGEVSVHLEQMVEAEPVAVSSAPPEPEPIEAIALRSLSVQPPEPETTPSPKSEPAAIEALAEPTAPVVAHAEQPEPHSELVRVVEVETIVVEAKTEIEVTAPPPSPDPIAELPPEPVVSRSLAPEPDAATTPLVKEEPAKAELRAEPVAVSISQAPPEPEQAEPLPPVAHAEPTEPVLVLEPEPLVVAGKPDAEHATAFTRSLDPFAAREPAQALSHDPPTLVGGPLLKPEPPAADVPSEPEALSIAQPPPEQPLVLEPEPLVVAAKPEIEAPAPARAAETIVALEPEPLVVHAAWEKAVEAPPPVPAPGVAIEPIAVAEKPVRAVAEPETRSVAPVVVEATPPAAAPEVAVTHEPVVTAELALEPVAPAPEPASEPPVAATATPSALAGTPLPDAAPITPTALGAVRPNGKTNGAHPPVAQPRLARPTPRPAPHDPLAPLALMSDEEKIALFS